jgi:tetraprenyl-beta-curcumene synthase
MLDAVTPGATSGDYYRHHSEREDRGYLKRLVETCRAMIGRLPSYSVAEPHVRELVSLYGDLQVYKHLQPELREPELHAWWERHRSRYPELRWNEFAAATGSTLGVFMLFLAAAEPGREATAVQAIRDAYFPYVCGLHILLDYLIDQAEDRAGGDLNFCQYYATTAETAARIAFMAERAREAVCSLEAPEFHRMVIEGLLALYLSDPKVARQPEVRLVARDLMRGSPSMRLFFRLNSVWIRFRRRLQRA